MIKSEKGFTLIELVATLALLSIVIVPISAVFIQGTRGYDTENRAAIQQDTVREAMNDIMIELGQHEFESKTYDVDKDLLSILDGTTKVKVGVSGNTQLTLKDTTKDIKYSWANGQQILNKTISPNTDPTKTWENITGFSVSEVLNGDSGIVTVEITSQIGTNKEFKLRNSYRRKSPIVEID